MTQPPGYPCGTTAEPGFPLSKRSPVRWAAGVARTKQFDPDVALRDALCLFWARG